MFRDTEVRIADGHAVLDQRKSAMQELERLLRDRPGYDELVTNLRQHPSVTVHMYTTKDGQGVFVLSKLEASHADRQVDWFGLLNSLFGEELSFSQMDCLQVSKFSDDATP
ncbi:MAG TPA: hypothetical protein VMQ44_01110 [Candidatus Saccharimonadales bacterium]|nr:hypothetical protein [Candidatus Saccharimonadales bacterium]